jgi:hypothetical protein
MAAWSSSPREVESLSVLVFRHKIGTPEKELVDHIPVTEYEFRKVARDFGPGTYYLKGSAGKFQTCNAKFIISDEFARNSGYGRLPEPPPPPPPQDLVAARTLQSVSQAAGIAPENLFAAIDRAIENSLNQRLGNGVISQAPINPMQALNDQMTAVEMQMNFMEKMEARVRRSIAGQTESPEGGDDLSWGGLIRELVKAAPGLIAAMRPAPASMNHQPIRPMPNVEMMPPPPAPDQVPTHEGEAMKIQESLSLEDRQLIGPAVEMLKPFTALLVRAASDQNRPAIKIADDLSGWVPPECYEAVIRLGQLTQERGPGMLGVIGHEFISERWSEIIQALARNLSETGE